MTDAGHPVTSACRVRGAVSVPPPFEFVMAFVATKPQAPVAIELHRNGEINPVSGLLAVAYSFLGIRPERAARYPAWHASRIASAI